MMLLDGFGFERGSGALRRYHFDLENGPAVIKDREGVEASGLKEVVTQARAVIAEMRDAHDLEELGAWTLVVRAADGAVLKRLTVE